MPFVREGSELVYERMRGDRLLAVRRQFGMKRVPFGQLLGLTGENRNIYLTVRRYEEGLREISPTVERLALMLEWFHREQQYLPDLDSGDLSKMFKVEEPANGY